MNSKINWQKCNNLIPVIIQDYNTFNVLMLGFMNNEALQLTLNTKKVHFFSRTKNRIWMKGEESGNTLNVIDIKIDCDNDSLLILSCPTGPICHNGTKSCFDYNIDFINELESIIENKILNKNGPGYTSMIIRRGIKRIVQKIGEEATEVVISVLKESRDKIIGEAADLLFHLILALKMKRISFLEIIELMKKRNITHAKNEKK